MREEKLSGAARARAVPAWKIFRPSCRNGRKKPAARLGAIGCFLDTTGARRCQCCERSGGGFLHRESDRRGPEETRPKGVNEDEFDRLIGRCGERGLDLTFIEVMPLGDIDGSGGFSRAGQFLPLSLVRERLARRWTLVADGYRSGGPARYFRIHETGGRLGLITPISGGFCDGCNRVRLTATGRLYPCLGRERSADLRTPLRTIPPESNAALHAVLRQAVAAKPEGHGFAADTSPARPMSATGG